MIWSCNKDSLGILCEELRPVDSGSCDILLSSLYSLYFRFFFFNLGVGTKRVFSALIVKKIQNYKSIVIKELRN